MSAMSEIRAPMTGSVVHIMAAAGQLVKSGQVLLIIEAMKMEHEIRAERDAQVLAVMTQPGDLVEADEVLLKLSASSPVDASVGAGDTPSPTATATTPDTVTTRTALQEVLSRNALTLDAARPHAAAKRHALGLRTARENIADLCDADSFVE